RASNQRSFLENRMQVIVATIAFGMGINKPDVRLIVHMAPSQSLEAYIQESGRAGRDGDVSRCILLASSADGGTLRRRANQNTIEIETLRRVYRDLRAQGVGKWVVLDRGDVTALTGDQTTSSVCIGLLEHAGFLRRHPDVGRQITVRWGQRSAESDAVQERDRFGRWLGQISAGSSVISVPTASACAELDCAPSILERALTAHAGVTAQFRNQAVCLEILPTNARRTNDVTTMLDQMHTREMKRVDEMVAYMQGSMCRHRHLARHVGERISDCGDACDVCRKQSPSFREDRVTLTDTERKKKRLGDPYYAALVAWRRERSREMTVPAFVVASDRLLESLAEAKPSCIEDLGKIKGIGAIKAELYGVEILRVVREVRTQEVRAGSR
ncbi:MAG TPA: HRDC domain-containing protein, partial [Thermomicrobiales bacterium]|nr:HRDC domain-containing protein [Thermomicrobiales bacterium]